ncbi:MAG: hypothetical protein ACK4YP_25050, partial [Myxococcota bacterium]
MLLLSLLIGCPPASDAKLDSGDPATGVLDCAEEGECCHAGLPPLSMCFETLHEGEVLVGAFGRWTASEELTFTTTAGDEVPVWLRTDRDTLDVLTAVAHAEEVTVTQQGSCDPKGGIHSSVHIAGPSGETLFLTGSGPVSDLGGWTVAFDEEASACALREGSTCSEYTREVPLSVRRGDDGGTYWQGDEAAFGPD